MPTRSTEAKNLGRRRVSRKIYEKLTQLNKVTKTYQQQAKEHTQQQENIKRTERAYPTAGKRTVRAVPTAG